MADEPSLSKEQIDRLVAAIERVERKRKIMLAGYLLAAAIVVLGEVAAFWVFATAPSGSFFGWVFLLPFALVGAILWAFGRWAARKR